MPEAIGVILVLVTFLLIGAILVFDTFNAKLDAISGTLNDLAPLIAALKTGTLTAEQQATLSTKLDGIANQATALKTQAQ